MRSQVWTWVRNPVGTKRFANQNFCFYFSTFFSWTGCHQIFFWSFQFQISGKKKRLRTKMSACIWNGDVPLVFCFFRHKNVFKCHKVLAYSLTTGTLAVLVYTRYKRMCAPFQYSVTGTRAFGLYSEATEFFLWALSVITQRCVGHW